LKMGLILEFGDLKKIVAKAAARSKPKGVV
jgi:hypothetical protein